MKTKPGLFSLLAKLGKGKRASGPRLLARLIRDEEGSYLVYMIFILPVLIGVGGLAGEASLLLYNHRTLQSAADAAALFVCNRWFFYVFFRLNPGLAPVTGLEAGGQERRETARVEGRR